MNSMAVSYKKGHLAESRAGHDKGTIYVITGGDDRFVYLADGRLKKVSAPKKKSLKHVFVIHFEQERLMKLIEDGRDITDADICSCRNRIDMFKIYLVF